MQKTFKNVHICNTPRKSQIKGVPLVPGPGAAEGRRGVRRSHVPSPIFHQKSAPSGEETLIIPQPPPLDTGLSGRNQSSYEFIRPCHTTWLNIYLETRGNFHKLFMALPNSSIRDLRSFFIWLIYYCSRRCSDCAEFDVFVRQGVRTSIYSFMTINWHLDGNGLHYI